MLTTLFVASLPAWGIGAFGPTGNRHDDAAARALLIRDGDSTVAAVQLDPKTSAEVCTWLIPFPGELDGPIRQLVDNSLESLLAASDPTYVSQAEDPIGCHCTEGISDTGEAADVRHFDRQLLLDAVDAEIYGPTDTAELIEAIDKSQLSLSSQATDVLWDYADKGWSVAMLRLGGGIDSDQSTPLIVYRYSGDEVVLPMALSPHNVDEEMQTVVLLVGEHRMDPVSSKGVKAKLGTPMYRSKLTRKFYNARFRVAIEEAGGHAWVLEYANTLEKLEGRVQDFNQIDPPTNVVKVFDDLQDVGVLSDAFDWDPPYITRWRSFIRQSRLTDETFERASSDKSYEISLDEDDFRYVRSGALVPLLAIGLWFRRRRPDEA